MQLHAGKGRSLLYSSVLQESGISSQEFAEEPNQDRRRKQDTLSGAEAESTVLEMIGQRVDSQGEKKGNEREACRYGIGDKIIPRYVNSRTSQYGADNTRKSPREKYETIVDSEISHAEKIRCGHRKERKERAITKPCHYCTYSQ